MARGEGELAAEELDHQATHTRAHFDDGAVVELKGSILGHAVLRSEDPRFLTGSARYTGDMPADGALHAVFVRSYCAHGVITALDTGEAAAMLAGRTHVGSLYLAGVPDGLLPMARARELLGRLELAGASRPAPGFILARALERSADRLEQAFWPIVAEARAALGLPRLDPSHVARRWFGPPVESRTSR